MRVLPAPSLDAGLAGARRGVSGGEGEFEAILRTDRAALCGKRRMQFQQPLVAGTAGTGCVAF